MGIPFNWLDPALKATSKAPVRVIGIDLGTTITTVTQVKWDPSSEEDPVASFVVIPQPVEGGGEQEFELIPSVVALVSDGPDEHIFVGEGAKRLKSQHERFRRNSEIWWESKNEIGTRRVWPQSPEGFKTPKDIAAKILTFIQNHIEDMDEQPIDRVVVTVPASFQVTQRQDTIDAADTAGIDLRAGDLLDEPVAAFLDFMAHDKENELLGDRENSRIMVVDFGGGTCDVALLTVRRNPEGGLEMARRGVSRFHRVGGGDLDLAIANDVLLPKLLAENSISPFEVNYVHKRDVLLPVLSTMAEILKINLSNKVRGLRALDNFDPTNQAIEAKQPGQLVIKSTGIEGHDVVTLSEPSLNLGEMMQAIGDFLNPNQVEPLANEYFGVTSIYSPIHDVMSRAEWTKEHVDEILLVGGSSLLHFVSESIATEFSDSNVRSFRDPLDAQRCVGRGAAWQAMLLTVYGKSPLSPTLGEGLSVMTSNGDKELIHENAELPYPGKSKTQSFSDLKVPSDVEGAPLPLVLSFKSGDASLKTSVIEIKPPVKKGAKIELEYNVDENQTITMSVVVDRSKSNQQFQIVLDNPLSVAANANADRDKILEIEEKLALLLSPEDNIAAVRELARLNRKLRGYERARQLLERLTKSTAGKLKGELYHELAGICSDMLDVEKCLEYFKSSLSNGFDLARFNYPLKLKQLGRLDEALRVVEETVLYRGEPKDLFLKANILMDMGRISEAIAVGNEAIRGVLPFSSLSDWMFGLAKRSVHLSKDGEWIEAYDREQKARDARPKRSPVDELEPEGYRPD